MNCKIYTHKRYLYAYILNIDDRYWSINELSDIFNAIEALTHHNGWKRDSDVGDLVAVINSSIQSMDDLQYYYPELFI